MNKNNMRATSGRNKKYYVRMHNLKFVLLIAGLYLSTVLNGQITINANKKEGCDQLTVNFSFTTTLPFVDPTKIKWNFGDGNTDVTASPEHTYTAPGSYSVKLVLNGTDSLTEPDFIKIGLTPEATIVYKDTFELGTYNLVIGVRLENNSPPFPYTYNWLGEGGLNQNQRRFVHKYDSAGAFRTRVYVTDTFKCADTARREIIVVDGFVVPNVFTPNGDDKNDELKVLSNGKDIFSFQVFSPSGLMVFKSEAKNISWDGKLPSGERVKPGIYYYVIATLSGSPPVKKAGFFYIYW